MTLSSLRSRLRVLAWPLVAAATVLLLPSCASAPEISPPLPDRSPQARGLIVIAHGVAGRANSWPLAMEARLLAASEAPELWDVYRLDWYRASLNRLAAPRRAAAMGRQIGEWAAEEGYEVIHLIAHSAGAHAIDAAAQAIRALRGDDGSVVIHATFIDPFVARRLTRLYWGVDRFGRDVDFAESYVTREDQVPFTNQLVERAHNIDLTSLVPDRAGRPGDFAHVWPLAYYLDADRDPRGAADRYGMAIAPTVLLGDRVDTVAARRVTAALLERMPRGETTVPAR